MTPPASHRGCCRHPLRYRHSRSCWLLADPRCSWSHLGARRQQGHAPFHALCSTRSETNTPRHRPESGTNEAPGARPGLQFFVFNMR